MSKSVNILTELTQIKNTLDKFPEGATMQIIKAASGINIPDRTFLRRLDALEEAGHARHEGKTLAKIFFPVLLNDTTQIPDESFERLEFPIPLSKEAMKIHIAVQKPLQQRTPVGYHREFLESYIPNKTFYLSFAERERLAGIGKTTMTEQAAGTYVKTILHRLLIDLSWNSSRLEGNTYSLLDTEKLIANGQEAENKSATEAQMIINHKAAIEFLASGDENIGFNSYTVLNLHAMLADNLLADLSAIGRLRIGIVGVTGSVYTPIAIPQVLQECFGMLLEKAAQIKDPFEQALFVMVQLPYLQPFVDVNKRVSRLALNIPFVQQNLSPLSFTEVPPDFYRTGLLGVYELNRVELLKDLFLWAYERSATQYIIVRQSLGDPDPFRLKYRVEIHEVIRDIVKAAANHLLTESKINEAALGISGQDRHQFVRTIQIELDSLHEGNYARYYIRPSEFATWKKVNEK